jgi:hypothetical protein
MPISDLKQLTNDRRARAATPEIRERGDPGDLPFSAVSARGR